jgi:hypothetical protein
VDTGERQEAAAKALDALRQMTIEPDVEHVRAAARALVDLRALFEHQGRPDWAGRSLDYRSTVERLYRDAGVPSDSSGPTLAKLRYHVGNTVRETAPVDDLEALGLQTSGPRERNNERRSTVTELRPKRKAHVLDLDRPVSLVEHARADIALLRECVSAGAVGSAALAPALRELMNEILDVLQAVS